MRVRVRCCLGQSSSRLGWAAISPQQPDSHTPSSYHNTENTPSLYFLSTTTTTYPQDDTHLRFQSSNLEYPSRRTNESTVQFIARNLLQTPPDHPTTALQKLLGALPDGKLSALPHPSSDCLEIDNLPVAAAIPPTHNSELCRRPLPSRSTGASATSPYTALTLSLMGRVDLQRRAEIIMCGYVFSEAPRPPLSNQRANAPFPPRSGKSKAKATSGNLSTLARSPNIIKP